MQWPHFAEIMSRSQEVQPQRRRRSFHGRKDDCMSFGLLAFEVSPGSQVRISQPFPPQDGWDFVLRKGCVFAACARHLSDRLRVRSFAPHLE